MKETGGVPAQTLKVAVTGGPGSGKSTVCSRFKALSVRVLSADELARKAVAPGTETYDRILAFFGHEVAGDGGYLNRRLLRRIIFEDAGARKVLEQMIHPEVLKTIQREMTQANIDGCKLVVVEVPLLYEVGMEVHFDVVIAVSTDRELQIKRLIARDKITREDAVMLLAAQLSDEEKAVRADFVIRNVGPIDEVIQRVDHIYENLLVLQKKRKDS
jgi:dephospho-CoA kinase